MRMTLKAVVLIASTAMMGCGQQSEDTSELMLRDLTRAEAAADFQEIVGNIKTLYGPLEYKESRFNFDLDAIAKSGKALLSKARTDAEYFGVSSRTPTARSI